MSAHAGPSLTLVVKNDRELSPRWAHQGHICAEVQHTHVLARQATVCRSETYNPLGMEGVKPGVFRVFRPSIGRFGFVPKVPRPVPIHACVTKGLFEASSRQLDV